MAHESVHEAQIGTPKEAVDPSSDMSVIPANSLRSGWIELATLLREPAVDIEPVPEEADRIAKYSHYVTRPVEVQAYVEQSHVASLVAERQLSEPMGPGIPDTLRSILPWMARASLHLSTELAPETGGASSSPDQGPGHAGRRPDRRYESAGNAEALEHGAMVLDLVADLNTAANSRGWNERIGADLAQSVRSVMDDLGELSPEEAATTGMGALAALLQSALFKFAGSPGVDFGTVNRASPAEAEFQAAKKSPLDRAERQNTAHGSVRAALVASLEQSGFLKKVQQLPEVMEGGLGAVETAMGEAVGSLAAHLLGMPVGRLPLPAIHLFLSPSPIIPVADGMNFHEGQKRKMSFDPGTWQIHIPLRPVDDSPEQWAGPLAKMAFDLAWTADLVRQGKLEDDRLLHDKSGATVVLRESLRLSEATAPPGSAAALLRAATSRHRAGAPPFHAGRLFHEGTRVELKKADADRYRTNAMDRWSDPAVALRRALVELVEEMSKDPPGAAAGVRR